MFNIQKLQSAGGKLTANLEQKWIVGIDQNASKMSLSLGKNFFFTGLPLTWHLDIIQFLYKLIPFIYIIISPSSIQMLKMVCLNWMLLVSWRTLITTITFYTLILSWNSCISTFHISQLINFIILRNYYHNY